MVRQIAIFIENQKGFLRKVTGALHEEQIGIFAVSTIDSPEFGIVRMIVDRPKEAVEVLNRKGFVAKTCEVIAVEIQRQELMDELLEVLQEGNININYIYSSFGLAGGYPAVILHAADMDETEDMLCGKGFQCLSKIVG